MMDRSLELKQNIRELIADLRANHCIPPYGHTGGTPEGSAGIELPDGTNISHHADGTWSYESGDGGTAFSTEHEGRLNIKGERALSAAVATLTEFRRLASQK